MKRETRKPKKLRKMAAVTFAALFTLAGVNIANADTTIKGTLDRIYPKSEGIISLINDTYTLTEITDPSSVPANAVTMTIGNTSYYYIPETTETYKLVDFQNLANTGNVALIGPKGSEYEDTINLKLGSNYYSYTTSKLPTSAYTLTEHATKQTGDITVGDKYYSIDLKTPTDKSGTGHVTYSLESGTKAADVSIPEGKTQTIYYTYNNGGYTSSSRVDNPTSNITNKLFNDVATAANGSAIYNNDNPAGSVNITADFTNNAITNPEVATSAAITNYTGDTPTTSSLGNIIGDFINNSITATGEYSYEIYAAAIFNRTRGGIATIGDITGDFINNHTESESSSANGGAIFNRLYDSAIDIAKIGNIKGNFINNYAKGTVAYGGAIYNSGTIASVTGDFTGNFADAKKSGLGGAIYNISGTIASITGDFIGNYAQGPTYALGGAIDNSRGTITSITGDFINNYAKGSTTIQGGAIYNKGTIASITGDFINNYAKPTTGDGNVSGGAIYNEGTITDISGGFTNNYTESSTLAQGGAIYNSGTNPITITGDFTGNHATSSTGMAIGGAIANCAGSTINFNGTNTFSNNHVEGSTTAQGGAIFNNGSSNNGIINFNGTNTFSNNYAQGTTAQGGAIYNKGIINFNGTNTFSGNYTTTDGTTHVANDIHNEGTINILGGTTTINGGISDAATPTGVINIGGTTDGTLTLGSDATLVAKTLTVNTNGTLIAKATALSVTDGITNSGTMELQGGTLASAIVGGTVNLTTDALRIGTGGSINQAAAISVDQAITVDGGTLYLNNNDTLTAQTTLTSGILDINGITDTTKGITANGGTLNISGDPENDYTILSANSSIAKTAKTTINCNLRINGATVNLNGETSQGAGDADTLAAGSTLIVQSGILNISDGFVKSGRFIQQSASATTNISGNFTLSKDSNTNYGDNVLGGALNILSGTTTVAYGNNVATLLQTGDSNATLNLASGATLDIQSGKVILDGGANADKVDWNGTVTNAGGELTLNGVTKNGVLTQTSGSTTVTGTTFALNNANDSITGGTLTIGDGSGTQYTENVLTINGGTLTTGDSGVTLNIKSDSTLSITGANQTVTLDGGDGFNKVNWDGKVVLNNATSTLFLNHIKQDVNKSGILDAESGNLTINNDNVLLGSNDIIKEAVKLTVTGDIHVASGSEITIDSSDNWTNSTALMEGGTLNLNGVTTSATKVNKVDGSTTGTGNIGIYGNVTLGNADTIASTIKTTINESATLTLNNATVTLNGVETATGKNDNDVWSDTGKIVLNGENATLTLKDFNTTNGNAISTTTGKTYNQSAGTLNLVDTELTLNSGSKIDGTSIINLDPSTLTFNNGVANQATLVTADSTINILGDGTSFTTLAGTSITGGRVVVGDNTSSALTTNPTLNFNEGTMTGGTMTINQYGKLVSSTDHIQVAVTNDGVYDLSTGVIANAIKDSADNASKGTLNLISGGSNTAIIKQANINVKSGTFTMSEDITAGTQLDIVSGAGINNASKTITATKLTNDGTIDGAGILNVINGNNNGSITQGKLNIATNDPNTGFSNGVTGVINITDTLTNDGLFSNLGTVSVTNTDKTALFANNSETRNGGTITTDTLKNDNAVITLAQGSLNVTNQKITTGSIAGTINASYTGNNLSIKGENATEIGVPSGQAFVGTLNVGNDVATSSVLNLRAGEVRSDATVNVLENAVLNITGADANDSTKQMAVVAINGNDTWNGEINVSNASGGNAADSSIGLMLEGVTKEIGVDTADYHQTGGTLVLKKDHSQEGDVGTIFKLDDSSKISGGHLSIDEASKYISGASTGYHNGFNVDMLYNAGIVDSLNGKYETHTINNLVAGNHLDSVADFTVDIFARSDANKDYDRFSANTIKTASPTLVGTINVLDWSLNGDLRGGAAPIDRYISLPEIFSGTISDGQIINFTSNPYKEVATPIGMYALVNRTNTAGGFGLELQSFNPEVFRGQVATVAQWENQLSIADMMFTHSMILPSFKEDLGDSKGTTGMYGNRYASSDPLYAPYQYSRKDGGLWCKMYGNFETLQMSNVGRVGNNAYGALIGADFGLKELRHGWKFMPTAYIGYNGAYQTYPGVGMYQNGGQAGFLGTWYKNNVILGGLVYGGVYDNAINVSGFNENTFNYFAGASAKAAYNWRFHRDWVLQPNLMVAYNYFGQQNWHSNYGQMSMMASALHGVNIAPGLNLIWEKDTFSTYLTIQYMYNINGAAGGQAGNVSLPQVYMDRGYIQYGIGFTKKFSDRFSGYLQAVIRNVGRNGGAFQAGFTWSLGKGPSNMNKELKSSTVQPKQTNVKLSAMK